MATSANIDSQIDRLWEQLRRLGYTEDLALGEEIVSELAILIYRQDGTKSNIISYDSCGPSWWITWENGSVKKVDPNW